MSKTKKAEAPHCDPVLPENVFADTHVGLVRDHNEDSFAYYIRPEKHKSLIAVADGIGGHESGDIASNLCLRLLVSATRRLDAVAHSTEKDWSKFLVDKIGRANGVIYDLNEKYKIQHPMGTTIVAGVFLEKSIVIAHAGDSRCYRLRDEKIERLTEDHSFVAELVRKKVISEDEAHVHPFAHIISRSVGPTAQLEPEVSVFERMPGDRYLLCSDGLTNHVDDSEIARIFSEADTPSKAVKNLLNASLRGGGEDNITIVCVFA